MIAFHCIIKLRFNYLLQMEVKLSIPFSSKLGLGAVLWFKDIFFCSNPVTGTRIYISRQCSDNGVVQISIVTNHNATCSMPKQLEQFLGKSQPVCSYICFYFLRKIFYFNFLSVSGCMKKSLGYTPLSINKKCH